MNDVAELFGRASGADGVDWCDVVANQECPFVGGKCTKNRKSSPDVSIGTCTVLYGRERDPLLICPSRLMERRQVFTDCLHLLTTHEPGNELHIVGQCPVPGGNVDYVLASTRSGRVVDFVGIELQTLDTTGTVWPARQRFLRERGMSEAGRGEPHPNRSFGINWKMTAKTILMQMHHKIQTFENVNRKMVLVIQDEFLEYMKGEFDFGHLSSPTVMGDSIHVHAYNVKRRADGSSYDLTLGPRFSTNADGIATCLDMRHDPNVELAKIIEMLQARISPATLFTPV